ncbi:MAG: hypothetical protein E6K82_13055 [Candidatus Rokuibacteriota bacterium]|nr:MAG: hypothetical protein E6K82_13055 [Candidatus Rokubacteria bacterium]
MAPIIGGLLAVALAAIVLARRPRGRASRAFVAFAAAFALWNFGVYQFRAAPDADLAQRWEVAVYIALFAAPALYYHLVHAVAGVPEGRASIVVYAGSIAAALAAAMRFDLFVSEVRRAPEGWVPLGGPLAIVWFVFTLGVTVATFRPLVLARRRRPPERASRPITLLLLATAIRLASPLVSFAGVLLVRSGVLDAALPPIVVGATLVVVCLAGVATLDTES